jgi:hypothetical protein
MKTVEEGENDETKLISELKRPIADRHVGAKSPVLLAIHQIRLEPKASNHIPNDIYSKN